MRDQEKIRRRLFQLQQLRFEQVLGQFQAHFNRSRGHFQGIVEHLRGTLELSLAHIDR